MIINLAKKMKLKTADKVCREDITINPLLQAKTVTDNGIIVPDAGYIGLGKVDVDVANTLSELASNPLMPRISNLKWFSNNRFFIGYAPMFLTKLSEKSGILINYSSADTIDDAESVFFRTFANKLSHELMMINLGDRTIMCQYAQGVVAAVTNYGTDSVYFPQMTFPRCSIKVRYEKDFTIHEMTKEFLGMTVEAYQRQESAEVNFLCAVRSLELPLFENGAANICSVEAIYPKANITFAGDASKVEYSINNGGEWLNASKGLVLEKVEHVYLRENAGSTIHVGTSEGANDVCTLQTSRYIADFSEDTTLYVS